MYEWSNFSTRKIIDCSLFPIMTISTEHFKYLKQDIAYTGIYSSELKLISRRFSEKALLSIGLAIPQQNLVYDSVREDELHLAWNSFLLELQDLGLQQDVCEWMMKLKADSGDFSELIGSYWRNVLNDWAMDIEGIPKLAIFQIKIDILKRLVLEKWTSDTFFQLHNIPELTKLLETDEWENYIINSRSTAKWLSNIKQLYQTIAFWVEIFDVLSTDELRVVDQWGYDIMNASNLAVPNYYYSIVELAHKFRARGYIKR